MAKTSKIEWTEATWNPWQGCIKLSAGCKNCYMYRDKRRYGQTPEIVVRSKTTFSAPMQWREPRVIFTCSWSDWFIPQADNWRQEAWEIIRQTPQHTYQILTKRPERILSSLPEDWGTGWENVWLGVSVENQECIERIRILKDTPAFIRFISAEPLLEHILLGDLTGIDWVISGGESGPKSRPMNIDWVRNIRDECLKAETAFFHKQHGGRKKIDGVWGGREIDSVEWNEMPDILVNKNYD
jgi:protein gp37